MEHITVSYKTEGLTWQVFNVLKRSVLALLYTLKTFEVRRVSRLSTWLVNSSLKTLIVAVGKALSWRFEC